MRSPRRPPRSGRIRSSGRFPRGTTPTCASATVWSNSVVAGARRSYHRSMTDTERSARRVPERPSLDGIEDHWSRRWQEEGTYAFDRSRERANVYAIDTPPPYVSGDLHMGHV